MGSACGRHRNANDEIFDLRESSECAACGVSELLGQTWVENGPTQPCDMTSGQLGRNADHESNFIQDNRASHDALQGTDQG
jgi:hypothetical protein